MPALLTSRSSVIGGDTGLTEMLIINPHNCVSQSPKTNPYGHTLTHTLTYWFFLPDCTLTDMCSALPIFQFFFLCFMVLSSFACKYHAQNKIMTNFPFVSLNTYQLGYTLSLCYEFLDCYTIITFISVYLGRTKVQGLFEAIQGLNEGCVKPGPNSLLPPCPATLLVPSLGWDVGHLVAWQ